MAKSHILKGAMSSYGKVLNYRLQVTIFSLRPNMAKPYIKMEQYFTFVVIM